MSDNWRRYYTIHAALKRLYPGEPHGNLARHLKTLALLICGIVGSRRTNLPAITGKCPRQVKEESQTKQFARWVANAHIDATLYFLPYAAALLDSLAHRALVLVMDSSTVGRDCLALMVSVLYHGRALPLAWVVVEGTAGHMAEATHSALLAQVQPLLPAGATVIFLGDGEFDGPGLQATLNGYGWQYVCRTAKSVILIEAGAEFSFRDVGPDRGQRISLPGVLFTRQGYGPVHAAAWWRKDCAEPIYLVSNLDLAAEIFYWYGRRFQIETFFSDQKSRGFHIHKSHLSDPARLARLLIAACLAYIWIVNLGARALQEGWIWTIHRTERCDLSLFQAGLRLLEYLLDQVKPIPVAFRMPELVGFQKSVR